MYRDALHPAPLLPLQVEAMALLEGLKLARGKGVKLAECCSYVISVVNQVNMFSWPFAEEGKIIFKIKEELQKHDLSSIIFSPRSANNVAHVLARRALDIPESCCWGFPLPSWLLYEVSIDLI
ncbi:hypothetical protein LguiA_029437 [Lonicera macranthoides]